VEMCAERGHDCTNMTQEEAQGEGAITTPPRAALEEAHRQGSKVDPVQLLRHVAEATTGWNARSKGLSLPLLGRAKKFR
jgi:hypothetical protein